MKLTVIHNFIHNFLRHRDDQFVVIVMLDICDDVFPPLSRPLALSPSRPLALSSSLSPSPSLHPFLSLPLA